MRFEDLATKQDIEMLRQELLQVFAKLSHNASPQKEWLRTKEVRDMLGLSAGSLSNWRIKGILKPTKIDGIYYYRLSEIMALLNAGAE